MDLYKELDVERGASQDEIRRAYRKLVVQHHPDKGGNPEKFKAIQKSYEILSDERAKSVYDQTGQIPGEDPGIPGGFPFGMGGMGGMGGGFPFDLGSMFGMFGGGGGGGSRRPREERQRGKAPPKKTTIPLSLSDFYTGKVLEMKLQQQRFCPDCNGEGSKQVSVCGGCGGHGVVRQVIQMGPMMMESHGPCPTCAGQGKQRGPPCGLCTGGKFVTRNKQIQITIPKGAKVGESLVLEGESSHHEGWTEPGDVVIQLVAADEDGMWTREGDILKTEVGIDLADSLCGCLVTISDHPAYPQGFVLEIPAFTQNGDTLVIKGAGMPVKGTETYGDAHIRVGVHVREETRATLLSHAETLRGLFHREPLVVQRAAIKGTIHSTSGQTP